MLSPIKRNSFLPKFSPLRVITVLGISVRFDGQLDACSTGCVGLLIKPKT